LRVVLEGGVRDHTGIESAAVARHSEPQSGPSKLCTKSPLLRQAVKRGRKRVQEQN